MLKKLFALFVQKKKLFFFYLLFLSASHFSFAQEKITVSGTVASDSSMPLSNVSVSIKGQAGGITSGSDGSFSIQVNKGVTLVFSMVGYEERQIRIDKATSGLSVKLTSKITGLNDVVVIGYGTQKVKDVTSSISAVNLNDERERPIVNIMQELAGKAAGVQVPVQWRPRTGFSGTYPGFYVFKWQCHTRVCSGWDRRI